MLALPATVIGPLYTLVPLSPPSTPLLMVTAWVMVVLLAASSPPLRVRVLVAPADRGDAALDTWVTPPVKIHAPVKVLLATVMDRLFAALPTVPARVRVPDPVNRPAVVADTFTLAARLNVPPAAPTVMIRAAV